MLDTILNVCSFRVIHAISEIRLGRRIWVGNFYAQGDDVIFSCTDLSGIHLIIDTYGKLSYQVHSQKTYISKCRGEFLRRSYEEQGVTGYLARTIHGLRFKNPIQDDPISLTERIYGHLTQWHLAYMRRGGQADRVVAMLMEDIKGMGVSTKKAASFFLTPISLGGVGVDPFSQCGARLAEYGDGEWYNLRITQELRNIDVKLGGWRSRLEPFRHIITPEEREKIIHNFAMSWGFRESDIVGKHMVE